MGSWVTGIRATTLFVEDLAATKQFYQQVFDVPLVFEDDTSAAFDFGNVIVNLLVAGEAPALIDPVPVAEPVAGSRFQFTITVDDVDAVCAELTRRGVELLSGPIDRPWGIRTAAFRDPAGHVWEVATW